MFIFRISLLNEKVISSPCCNISFPFVQTLLNLPRPYKNSRNIKLNYLIVGKIIEPNKRRNTLVFASARHNSKQSSRFKMILDIRDQDYLRSDDDIARERVVVYNDIFICFAIHCSQKFLIYYGFANVLCTLFLNFF